MTIFQTQNEDWGFWGTARNFIKSKKEMKKLWGEISIVLQNNGGLTPEQTLKLLDSRWGRHFVDRYCEELRTNIQTFIETVDRRLTKKNIISDYRYYVDDKAFKEAVPDDYDRFAKELEKLSRKYCITIQAVGGVRLCSANEIQHFVGYTKDLESGDILPIWEEE